MPLVRDIFSPPVVVDSYVPGEDMARQEFKDECDINRIMKRAAKTGLLPVSPVSPKFGDFSEVGDFQAAQNGVLAAREEFGRLPSDVRKRFANNPALLVEFLADKANREEAIKLGLVEKPKPEPGPVKVEVVNVPPGGAK